MPVGIIATLPVQDGKQDAFEAAFAKLQEIVRAQESGCQLYTLCREQKNSAVYRVMEQYADADALKAHGASDEAKAAMAALGAFLDGAPDITVVDIIG